MCTIVRISLLHFYRENVSIVCNGDTWTQLCREMAAAQKSEFDASKLDLNFTHWDLKVQIVDVRLSLW